MSRRKKSGRELRLENLESRKLMAVIGYNSVSDEVSIYGDSWNNEAVVRMVGSKVQVSVTSTPSSGFSLVPETVTREFSRASDVDKIRFFGESGNDRFVSYLKTTPVYASGGNGDDYIETYNGKDEIYGGAGVDTIKSFGGDDLVHGGSGGDFIYGGNGNDDLYGDAGDDTIYGQADNDGLYGGTGADKLYGGSGADRFLVMSGQKEHKDATSGDAIVWFKNGTKKWSEEEIEDVDLGLKVLHQKTGNDNLLELKSGKSMTFERQGAKGSTLASNNSAGKVVMYDKAFSSADRTAATTVHELAHNWDAEHASWKSWLKASGWTTTNPKSSLYAKTTAYGETWWYLKSASFSSSYADSHPMEDWSEAWQNYFTDTKELKNIESMSKLGATKAAHLDAFFASLA